MGDGLAYIYLGGPCLLVTELHLLTLVCFLISTKPQEEAKERERGRGKGERGRRGKEGRGREREMERGDAWIWICQNN